MNLVHRGQEIKGSLLSRRQLRRSRRNRKTRYRKARFDNRPKATGWLPPSLDHRLQTTLTWVTRLSKFSPIASLALERVKFDTQKMENPEVSGVEYQQGALQGYEVREYLLEKWGRRCVYCEAENVPLEVEHIKPKSKGGSNRVSNLTLSCRPCNEAKGTKSVADFLSKKPEILEKILSQAKRSLASTAAVNATRNALLNGLQKVSLVVSTGTGAQTKFNRIKNEYPKDHWIDAACVGSSGSEVRLNPEMHVLEIKSTGHGSRQFCGTNKYGFPVRHRSAMKKHFGFETGDMVIAVVPSGKKAGRHKGRVLCRATGSFDISTGQGRVQGISHRYFRVSQRKDGYNYRYLKGSPSSPWLKPGASGENLR
jgi:5-methylcytosine-specific restriction endonuclease McrA